MRWSASVASVMTLGVLAAATAAHGAGSYEVPACNRAPEGVNNSWIWSTSDTSLPAHFAEHSNCPYRIGGSGGTSDQEGGLSSTDALGLSSGSQPGMSAGWTFTAPSGTTIGEINYERYIGHQIDPNNSWSPALRADDAIVPGETCLDSVQNGETCSVGGPPGQDEPGVLPGLSAHELTVGMVCQAPTEEECVTGATQYGVWATLYGATVTVFDPSAPTLGLPSGALWGQAGAVHSGTQSVVVSAQDVGGGVRSLTLSADGRPVAGYSAACDYTFAQPCPASIPEQTLTLPTTTLSDGAHTLALVARDAAGNESASASEQIEIQNASPPSLGAGAASVPPGSVGAGSRPGGPGNGPRIRLGVALHGRRLIVKVRGPKSGVVHVSFTARLHGRLVLSGAKAVALTHGSLRASFKLGPRTAAHASIRVGARLSHQRLTTAILRGSQR